jgi:hypothetical protein
MDQYWRILCYPMAVTSTKIWHHYFGINNRWLSNRTICDSKLPHFSPLCWPPWKNIFPFIGGCIPSRSWRNVISAEWCHSSFIMPNVQFVKQPLVYVPVTGIWWSGPHILLVWTNLILYYVDASKKINVMELRIATTWSVTAVPNVKGQSRHMVHISMTPSDVNVKYACEEILSNSCEEIYRTVHKSTLHDWALVLNVV